jgi:hypothetical protein
MSAVMKTKLYLSLLLSFALNVLNSQIPQGFNYMAIAKNADGDLLLNQDLTVRVAILTIIVADYDTTVVWEEEHLVTTDDNGLFHLIVGDPDATHIGGSSDSFSEIDWLSQATYLRTKIDGLYLGTTQLFSVPYALVAGNVSPGSGIPFVMNGDTIVFSNSIGIGTTTPNKAKLSVTGDYPQTEDALFEVKREDGQSMFAVYNQGVRINVPMDDGVKGKKGGFAIGGFAGTKGETYDLFTLSKDSARIYIDNTPDLAKVKKGGFAIGGFNAAGKSVEQEYLTVTPDSTRIYVKEGTKASKGGFAIGGFGGTKTNSGNFLDLRKDNYFIGHESGSKNNSGQYNSFIGFNAGKSNTDGSSNIFIGYKSGASNTTGLRNIFVGTAAGYTSNGNNNIIMGDSAGYALTHGDYNIVIGDLAGHSLTTGNVNVLIGQSAGLNHTTQEYNVMIGQNAGYNLLGGGMWVGSFNTFMGINAGYKIAIGKENVFLGTNAGYFIENGYGNTIVGIDAGRSGEEHNLGYDASFNTLLGDKAAYFITSGDNNVVIGYQSGSSLTSGSGNVFIGSYSGYPETGSNKLYIANTYDEDFPTPPLIYGDFSTARIGLGTTNPGYALDVAGDINITGNFRVNGSPLSTTTLTTGYLTATGPIILSNSSRKLVDGAATISIANASTSTSGAVQLSNSYSGTSESSATTEKALTDGLSTKVTGAGMFMGQVSLTGTGTIITTTTKNGTFELYWDKDGGSIELMNKDTDIPCIYWFQTQSGTTTTGGSSIIVAGDGDKIINGTNTDYKGFEIHFTPADGSSGMCSIWLQYYDGILTGNYIIN